MGIPAALSDILADEARLDIVDDESIASAIAALDNIADMLKDGRRPVWRVDGKLCLERELSPQGRRVFCSVCHLGSITLYDPEIEAAYLICDGKLLMIVESRPSREFTHWRVRLAGDRTQIPVDSDARVYVSPDFNLHGKTLEEIRG